MLAARTSRHPAVQRATPSRPVRLATALWAAAPLQFPSRRASCSSFLAAWLASYQRSAARLARPRGAFNNNLITNLARWSVARPTIGLFQALRIGAQPDTGWAD